METQKFYYKNCTIEVILDESPQNPFEDLDGNWPLMYYLDRYLKDFTNGEIDRFLTGYLSINQITRHQNKILDMLDYSKEDFNLDYPLKEYTGNERAQMLQDQLYDFITDTLENRETFCNTFGIPCYLNTSSGYRQGDWADVFICWTPKFCKETGISMNEATPERMKEGGFDLFTYWAWGDVYGYSAETEDGEDIFSCWGFYGDDPEKSGLMDDAKSNIDYFLEDKRKTRQEKVKTLIHNKVPLDKRLELI